MRATPYIVAFILTSCHPVHAKDYAISSNKMGGITVLTDQMCRYDKHLPEAYTTDNKGNKAYACYWFGVTNIYFEPADNTVRYLPKKDFKLITAVI
jgi:hypothetical protein